MIFPSRRFIMSSELYPAQAEEALRARLQPKRDWKSMIMRPGGGGFTGTLSNGHFRFYRDINYQNSFLPVVEGEIRGGEGPPSRIHVRMGTNLGVRVFLSFWLFFVGLAGAGVLAAYVDPSFVQKMGSRMGSGAAHHAGPPPLPAVIVPLVMLVFGLALPQIGFRGEARRATEFLKEVFGAQIEAEPVADRAI
ncbi:MAG: hypothetical protein GC185_07860 [Alphaproteobacteria bacterium]|nr:hypothetical protein [Alphaproteobacteria bacterium]